MNVPFKYQKTNEINQETLNHIKSTITKYTCAYKKYIKVSQSQLQSSYKDKVIKWLFSFPLEERQSICCIENKWATTILHQLYLLTITKPQLKFIPRDYSISNTSASALSSLMKGNSNNNTMTFQPSPNHFLSYFAMVSEKCDYHQIDNNILNIFLTDLKFYYNEHNILSFNMNDLKTYGTFDPKEYYSYFILGNKLLYNETNFRYFFNIISNNNLFNAPLGISNGIIDQPDWAKQPEGSNICFSLIEIIAGLFEQVITVKYIIDSYGDCKDTTHIGKCMSLRKELIDFLRNQNSKDLYEYLHCEDIALSVYYDVAIERMVEEKMYKDKEVGNIRRIMYWENNAGIDKVLKRLKEYLMGIIDDEEVFVERMMFARMSQLYTYEDFFQRKVFAFLYGLYTKSITDDLVNDLKMDSSMSTANSVKKNKKKKKKRKGKNNSNGGNENEELIKDDIGKQKRVFGFIQLAPNKENYTMMIDNNNEDNKENKEVIDSKCCCSQLKSNEDINPNVIDKEIEKDNNSNISCISLHNSITKKEKKIYNFILPPSSSKTDNSTTTPIKHPINSNSKFIQKEFMGSLMYIQSSSISLNTSSTPNLNSLITTPMIKSIINDLIISLPLPNQQNNMINKISSENSTSLSIINKSKAKKQKASKFFLYSTEPKKLKNQSKNPKKSFISLLNSDIIQFEENINSILTQLSSIKQAIISLLKSHINSIITIPHDIELYGSYENGLSIEGSDIDMQFIIKTNSPNTTSIRHKKNLLNINSINAIMKRIADYFQSCGDLYTTVIPIYTATVPIIKLKINPEIYLKANKEDSLLNNYLMFKDTCIYDKYHFHKEELDYIKFDITFNFNNNSKSTPKAQVNYIKEALISHPHMRSIIKIIKRILNISNLNNAYTGGLSSYTVFLMVYALQKSYVKAPCANSYSHLLIDFFNWYRQFNLAQNSIDVSYENPYAKNKDEDDDINTPMIIDPVTNLNAAKSSFKMKELKELFRLCAEKLSDLKQLYEESSDINNEKINGNIIELLMSCLH